MFIVLGVPALLLLFGCGMWVFAPPWVRFVMAASLAWFGVAVGIRCGGSGFVDLLLGAGLAVVLTGVFLGALKWWERQAK